MKKIVFLLPVLFAVFFRVPAFAGDFVTKKIWMEGQDYITIGTQGGEWKIDYRCYPTLSIALTESKQGLLQEGKTIYFITDEAYQLEEGVEVVCQNGDAVIETESIALPEGNFYAVYLKQIVNEKNLPLTIRFSTYPYIGRTAAEEKKSIPLPLYFITGPKYHDNLFIGEEGDKDEMVLLNKNFFMAVEVRRSQSEPGLNDLTRHLEIQVGQNYLIYDGKQADLSVPAYLDDAGNVMLPIREVAENLGPSVHVEYDEENKAVLVQIYEQKITFPLEGTQYTISNLSLPYNVPIAIREGKAFLSVTDLASALSIPKDDVKWDADTQTVIFNESFSTTEEG